MNGIHSTGIIIPYFIEVGTHFDIVMFARTFIGIPVGVGLWFVTSLMLNGLALFSGEIARALLGSGEADRMARPNQFYATPMYQERSRVYASGENND